MDENYRKKIIEIIKDMRREGKTDEEIKKTLLNMNLPESLIDQLMDVAKASFLEEEELKIEKHIKDYINKEIEKFISNFEEDFNKRIKELNNSLSNEISEQIKSFDKKYYEKLEKIEEELKVVNSNLHDLDKRIEHLEENWAVFAWTSTKIRNFLSYLCIMSGILILLYFVYYILVNPQSILMEYYSSGEIKKVVVAFMYTLIPLAASALLFIISYYFPRLK